MLTLLLCLGLAAADVDPAAFHAGNDELREYLLQAAADNPRLHAAFEEWQAALQRVPQAMALDDPMLMFGPFLRSDSKRYRVELEQKFPWFGTLRARGEKAAADADAALNRFYAMRNEVFQRVKQAYFDYALIAQSIGLTSEQAKLLTEMEKLVRDRYAVGIAPEAEVLRAQIEQDQLRDKVRGLETALPAAAAALNEAMGKQDAPDQPSPSDAELPPHPPELKEILARVRKLNPELMATADVIRGREHEIELARKRGYPDFNVSLMWEKMKNLPGTSQREKNFMAIDAGRTLLDGIPSKGVLPAVDDAAYDILKERGTRQRLEVKDDVLVTLQVNVPVWRKKIKAGIREAEHMRDAAESSQAQTALALERSAKKAWYDIQDAWRRRDLYAETLIPRAKDTLASFQSAYAAGTTADFVDLLESGRALLEFQLELARANRDIQTASAELEMILGAPWSEDTPNPPPVTEAQGTK